MRWPFAAALVCGLIFFSIHFWRFKKEVPFFTIAGVDLIALPGHPSGVACSPDGNWVFVAIKGGSPATSKPSGDNIVVLHKNKGKFAIERLIPVPNWVFGMVLTHDGKTLAVTADTTVVLLDVGRMTSGVGDPHLAEFNDQGDSPIHVNVTADDKILFVSNEGDASISVVDLARVRANPHDKKATIGRIPVGDAPIALAFSPDERWLYSTSEGAPPEWKWPKTEQPEEPPSTRPVELETQGAVVVVDVARARVDPAHSVVRRVPAGNSPVRMILSADGRTVYVTARGGNQLLVFDAGMLLSDPQNSLLEAVTVGSEPVPLALVNNGTTLVVGNSNREQLSAETQDTLTLLNVGQSGRDIRTIGNIAAGKFPREMCVSPDGQTLFVSNFRSRSLQVIDTRELPTR